LKTHINHQTTKISVHDLNGYPKSWIRFNPVFNWLELWLIHNLIGWSCVGVRVTCITIHNLIGWSCVRVRVTCITIHNFIGWSCIRCDNL